jgi:hypothetical protein
MSKNSNEPKYVEDMEFEEYVRWAKEHAMTKFLETGISGMNQAIYNIVQATAYNKVFGGKKK